MISQKIYVKSYFFSSSFLWGIPFFITSDQIEALNPEAFRKTNTRMCSFLTAEVTQTVQKWNVEEDTHAGRRSDTWKLFNKKKIE